MHAHRAFWLVVALTGVTVPAAKLEADEPPGDHSPDKAKMNWNIASRTLGGKQFWTDHFIHGEWRIQKSALDGHYRLLDPANDRQAKGSWDHCFQQWKIHQVEDKVPPLGPKITIVLHGLGRTRAAMQGLSKYLADQGHYSVLNFSYASTRASIGEHAAALSHVVEHLEGAKEINFVGHSMGNLVVRYYLGEQMSASPGRRIDPRIGRIVMLAPPNNGANLAQRLQKNPLFRLMLGTAGQQLGKDWGKIQARLATPPCPFGIIAGGGPNGKGRNPLLPGDDDLIVSVQETRLPGAADFIVVPAVHTLIMDHPDVRKHVLTFLQHGYFISESRRQPIAAQPQTQEQSP